MTRSTQMFSFFELAQGSLEKGGSAFLSLVRQHFNVGETGRIIDRNMDEVPAATAVSGRSFAGDAVTDPIESAEFLDVEVDQFARAFAFFVAHHRELFLEQMKTPPIPSQRSQPATVERFNLSRFAIAAPVRRCSHRNRSVIVGSAKRLAIRVGAEAVLCKAQRRPGDGAQAICAHAHPDRRCDLTGRPACVEAGGHQLSNMRRGSGILVGVHGGAPEEGWFRNRQLTAGATPFLPSGTPASRQRFMMEKVTGASRLEVGRYLHPKCAAGAEAAPASPVLLGWRRRPLHSRLRYAHRPAKNSGAQAST